MEDIIERINAEIERLRRENIEPAERNINVLGDNRIREMAERFIDYRRILETARDNNDIESLVNYANKLFQRIDWISSEVEVTDNRIDSLKILIYIFNLFIQENQRINFLEIESTQNNAETITNIIRAKENQ